ncbi:MAG: PAS domain-containing protein [Desulfobulbaceae bacterium]|nr:PAS domain-containing protein [Desulfobulbaceae bacterium]
MRKPLIKSLLIAALLSLSGIAGNTLALPIAFGVMFIFGSIFSVIAVSRLGTWLGVTVALIASSYTFFLWHHPYAIIIFTAEILWMGFALQRGRSNLLLIDSLYWLLLGCPLVALFYGGIMELGFQHTVIIVLKQALNGMLNTLVAWIGMSLLPRLSWNSPPLYHRPIPYNQVIFQMAAAFLMIPALGILLFLTRREVSATQTRTLHDIQVESQLTAHSIGKWITDYQNATSIIAELGTSHPLQPSNILQEELKSIHQLFPLFHAVFLSDGMATIVACDPPVNAKRESTIGINLSDRAWFKEMKSTLQPTISDVFTGQATIFAPIITISTPIINNGQLSHYGVGTINLNQLEQLLEQTSHYQKMAFTILDRHDKVIVSTDRSRQPLEAIQQTTGQIIPVSETTDLFIPGSQKNISIMDSWKGAYYFSRLPIPDTPWTLLMESSLAPMQSYFYDSTIWGLSIVTAFLMVMLALASFISRYLTTPVLALARISQNLPAKIAGQEKISWPQSNFFELRELIENFQHSAATIDHNLATINAYNAELEKTVLARTADLEQERQRLDSIIEGTNVGTWEWNVQSGETLYNERWASILGYHLTELQPLNIQTWLERTHPEDLKLSESLLEQHFAGILDYYECECRMRHKDGHWVWLHDRGKVMSHTVDGKPLLMSGTHTDISSRKQAEMELQESQARLLDAEKFARATIDALPAHLCVVNSQGDILSVNKSWQSFAQENGFVGTNTWLGVNYLTVCDKSAGPNAPEAATIATAIRAILSGCDNEFSMVYPCDGPTKSRWFEAKISRFKRGNENCAVIMHSDISTTKLTGLRLQEKTRQLESLTKNLAQQVEEEVALRLQSEQILIHQSKLAAMGEMLGAIAHQWRQPLNALGLIIQNLQEASTFGEMNQAVLDRTVQKSMNLIHHMSRTIEDFRNFFKPDKQKSTFDAMRVVGEVLQLVSEQLSSNHISYYLTCHTHDKSYDVMTTLPSCEAMVIAGYRNEFRHVIINLLSNAQDAILAHRAAANTQNAVPSRIDIDFVHADGTITIKIADNGGGISAESIDHIFEPYFTTKAPDKGTGTGLYMSKLIIEHMDGGLSVHNTAQGAVFTIELPGLKNADEVPSSCFLESQSHLESSVSKE